MKTLRFHGAIGEQMDDQDGADFGVLIDTDGGEYLLLADPRIIMNAAEKMYHAARKSLRLQQAESSIDNVSIPKGEISDLAPAATQEGQAPDQLAVTMSLDSGLPISFALSQRDIDLMAAALAKIQKPKRHHS